MQNEPAQETAFRAAGFPLPGGEVLAHRTPFHPKPIVGCTGSCEIVQVPTAMQLVALPHETPDTPPGGLFSVR